jgi:hypothetical protein
MLKQTKDTESDLSQEAISVAQSFLQAIKRREMELAQSFLAPEFRIIVPGGITFRTLSEHVAWAKSHYSRVTTVYEYFDAAFTPQGIAVYCVGTLTGEYPDGTTFSSIRFIDRLVVCNGKLVELQIWNDMDTFLKTKS